jgi:multidrug resistance protein, MATE family
MSTNTYRFEFTKTIQLAIPIIIAQLGIVLMGVADNIMVGRLLGKVALGTAGIANSVAFLIASLVVGGMSVVAPLISKAKAERNSAEINRLFRASMWVAGGYSVFLSAIGFLAAYFFPVFQQPEVINQHAPQFLVVIILSNIPMYFFVAAKQLTDGLGYTKMAMTVTVIGLVFNVIANYLLITGVGIFPEMGLLGAAYATFASRCIMLIGMLWFILKNRSFLPYFRTAYKTLAIQELIKTIYRLSIPGGLQFFFEIGAFAFAVIMMGWLGDVPLAAHQVAINIAATAYMMATGIAAAGSIRVGNGRGEKSFANILRSGNVALILVGIFMFLTMIVIIVLDEPLIKLYITDTDVLALAVELLFIAALFQLSDGLQAVGLGILRGLSDVALPTFITLFAYWGLALPIGYWLGFHENQGAVGIWVGLFIGLTVAAVLLIARFYWILSKKKDYFTRK